MTTFSSCSYSPKFSKPTKKVEKAEKKESVSIFFFWFGKRTLKRAKTSRNDTIVLATIHIFNPR